MRRLTLAVVLCFVSYSGIAADEPKGKQVAIDSQPAINSQVMPAFLTQVKQAPLQLAWNAKSVAEHQQWYHAFHAKMLELLGRMPQSVPLEVRWAERVEFDVFVRHKLYVRTENNYWSPAYYFVPRNLPNPTPAIVCLHGHSGIYPYIREGTDAERKKCQELSLDYAVYLAEHGYITIAPVIRGWNETSAFESQRRSCRRVTMDTFLLGMTPMGLRCWDAMRLVDFLQSRQEVDSEQIGVAGLSGGGTLATYLPILDERIKLAMIGGAFGSYRSSIYAIPHCICNCLPHVLQWGEMSDVVALHAPRPVLLVHGIEDHIFPIDSVREGYDKLSRVYKLLGECQNLDADFFDGPHAWSHEKTLGFLARHFGTKH